MPKFIDGHITGSLTVEQCGELQIATKDKSGVAYHDILLTRKRIPSQQFVELRKRLVDTS